MAQKLSEKLVKKSCWLYCGNYGPAYIGQSLQLEPCKSKQLHREARLETGGAQEPLRVLLI